MERNNSSYVIVGVMRPNVSFSVFNDFGSASGQFMNLVMDLSDMGHDEMARSVAGIRYAHIPQNSNE